MTTTTTFVEAAVYDKQQKALKNFVLMFVVVIALCSGYLGVQYGQLSERVDIKATVVQMSDNVRDRVSLMIMSEETKRHFAEQAVRLNVVEQELVAVTQQRNTAVKENMELRSRLDKALIPESTVYEAAANHVAKPVRDAVVATGTYAKSLYAEAMSYEFKPEKVTKFFNGN